MSSSFFVLLISTLPLLTLDRFRSLLISTHLMIHLAFWTTSHQSQRLLLFSLQPIFLQPDPLTLNFTLLMTHILRYFPLLCTTQSQIYSTIILCCSNILLLLNLLNNDCYLRLRLRPIVL